MLVRAADFEAALSIAEREARGYARGEYLNLYGQKVRMKYLGECDAYALFDPPGEGVEVFSRTELVSKRLRDRAIGTALFGTPEKSPNPVRRKFLNRQLTSPSWPASDQRLDRSGLRPSRGNRLEERVRSTRRPLGSGRLPV